MIRDEAAIHSVRTWLAGDRAPNRGTGLLLAHLALLSANHRLARLDYLASATDVAASRLSEFAERASTGDFALNGADVCAVLLHQAGVRIVFAYAGTSELALCNSIAQMSGCRLLNSRGDREAAFFAAGASLLVPVTASAVLHGARGLSNALGAIGDAHRNEVSLLALVGMPSTASAGYLPPHGEERLLEAAAPLTKYRTEIDSSAGLVAALRTAIDRARSRPRGPAVVGLPQDVLETSRVSWRDLASVEFAPQNLTPASEDICRAVDLVVSARRVVLLVDDYYLSYPDGLVALNSLAQACAGTVFQVMYQRGAVLFQRMPSHRISAFRGWYDPDDATHRAVLSAADLLITVEDRNAYPRIVGQLPGCRKIALTSNPPRTAKNGYLTDHDLVVPGAVDEALAAIARGIRPGHAPQSASEVPQAVPQHEPHAAAETGWFVARAIADAMALAGEALLVDDAQLFGALLRCGYDAFPPEIKIFGSHGGFVGSGLGYAIGLALGRPGSRVFCTLGDQGLTNAIQALVAAREHCAAVTVVVCNNGGSRSLRAQVEADGYTELAGYLSNPPNLDYVRVAEALGIPAVRVHLDAKGVPAELTHFLVASTRQVGPALAELSTPPNMAAWDVLWPARGRV